MGYLYLGLAIVGELLGTSLLKASAGFSRIGIALAALAAYGACFFFLARSLQSINLNVAYAIWAGLGVVLTTIIAVVIWKEAVNLPTVIGIALILVGVVVLNLFGAEG